MTTPDDERGASTRGFTLVEVLLASLIAGMTVVAAGWAMSGAAQTKAILEEEPSLAATLAREIFELAKPLPRVPGGVTAVTSGADVLALDALDGAVFSPPIRANRSSMDALTSWTQRVDVSTYAMADLTTKLDGGAYHHVGYGEAKLYQVSVEVLLDGNAIDTFSWWVKP